MQMEQIESSLLFARGYDAATEIMHIRFKNQKTGEPAALYEYGGVSPATWEAACVWISDRTGELSFGQFFQRFIKPDAKQYPFRKLEDAPLVAIGTTASSPATTGTVDFASQQPIPATEIEVLPADPDELGQRAVELQKTAAAIKIVSAEAYQLAAKTGMAIARMRDALERTFRPGIDKAHKVWKAELAVLNHYDKPLEDDQNRLREGMKAYNRQKALEAQQESDRLRKIEQDKAEEDAKRKADELKLSDAIEAEERGEPEIRDQIMAAPALPLTPAYVPPVYVQSEAPKVKGSPVVERWVFEITDRSLIPREYFILDEKAVGKVVSALKGRTAIPGIRVYDEGNVRFSKR